MPAPLSLDIRKRIVAAVEGGTSCRAAAARFAVSESAAIKLLPGTKHLVRQRRPVCWTNLALH